MLLETAKFILEKLQRENDDVILNIKIYGENHILITYQNIIGGTILSHNGTLCVFDDEITLNNFADTL